MTFEAFKDVFFDFLNETSKLPISNILTHDKESLFEIILDDQSEFLLFILPRDILH